MVIKMYQVMIVDDEYKNVLLLQKAVAWEEYGFCVCATAEDGKEALEKYRQLHPDVILVDIRMPIMDGLEFIRELRKIDQKVILLVISAYDDFKYAQTAISLGVSGYILKPVNRKELKATLLKIYDELKQPKVDSAAFSQLQIAIRYQKVGAQLQELLSTPGTHKESQELSSLFQAGREFRMAYVPDWEFSFERLDIHSAIEDFYCFKQNEKSVGLFPSAQHREMTAAFNKYLDREGISVILYLGLPICSKEELPTRYRQLQELAKSCFYIEGSAILEQGRQMDRLPSDIRQIATPEQIERFVFDGQANPLILAVEDAFGEAKENGVNPDVLREKSIYFLIQIKQSLTKVYGESTFSILRHIDYPKIASFHYCQNLKCFLQKVLADCEEQLHALWAEKGKNSLVFRAISYTDNNCYSPDFMVQQVASHVGLSKNYFLTLFRQETGQRFWDYVTGLRMERAKQLLRETDKTVYEVSIMVGYESEYHFSRKFKKIIGIKASEYRRNTVTSDD
ncbi:response regulator transcription factor [Parablautia intestinalis]|uniref:response regulator transcription factor n=1 Tax=Parablautia intestinalis TaxID=2320100 RepID=UPI00259CF599|nr:response regulator [Parablautia intestinalis]